MVHHSLLFLLSLDCVSVLSAPASKDIEYVVALKQRNLASFEKLFWDISTPGSPEYLRFRTQAQIAQTIGASDQDIADTREWLISLGARASSVHVSPLRDSVAATFASPPDQATIMGGPLKAGHPVAVDDKVGIRRPAVVEFVIRHDTDGGSTPTLMSLPRFGATSDDSTRMKTSEASEYTVANIKKAYGMPTDLMARNESTLQMVWGPGTFGFSRLRLSYFKKQQCPLLNTSRVLFDTENHGRSGGDNFQEGELDTHMISSFGLNVRTLVSNTNTSTSTEEGSGFGQALLTFLMSLSQRDKLPQVLSMSLGSLSSASCKLLCDKAVEKGHSQQECWDYMQQQRQVCMFLSDEQTARISTALQVLGTRGVTVLGSSGDGGSHFSFGRFSGGALANTLNEISCELQMPVFPTSSPYIVSVGGEMWKRGSSSHPINWEGFGGGSGGGFSWQFDMPEHQKASVAKYIKKAASHLPPTKGFNVNGRAYPDMAAVGVMGTSQSCPIAAGLWSMVIDARLNAGLPPLGFLAPRLWQVAEQFPGEAFEDITEGNSATSCDNGFPSTEGWDPTTGWGRPIWAGLLKHFASDKMTGRTHDQQRELDTLVV